MSSLSISVKSPQKTMELDFALTEGDEVMNATMDEGDSLIRGDFGEIQQVAVGSYEHLTDKPKIEGNVLIGDKTFVQLGLDPITASEIDDMMLNDLIENLNGGN